MNKKGDFAERGILIRFDHDWQKKEIEEEARRDGRSLNNYLMHHLGLERGWADRDPETGKSVVHRALRPHPRPPL